MSTTTTYTNDFKDLAGDSHMSKVGQRAVVEAAVIRQIACPFTDKALNVRTAVVIIPKSTGKTIVVDAELWDERHEAVAKAAPGGIEVYDGRELW
jgi:hypothetical protein